METKHAWWIFLYLFCQFVTISFSDDNVIIVIGGDDNYEDEDEGNKVVLSRWAWKKISSQFDGEYLDGRKSFVFSWDEKHREIHEQALLHYFDQNNKRQKFEPKPKEKVKNIIFYFIANVTTDYSDFVEVTGLQHFLALRARCMFYFHSASIVSLPLVNVFDYILTSF